MTNPIDRAIAWADPGSATSVHPDDLRELVADYVGARDRLTADGSVQRDHTFDGADRIFADATGADVELAGLATLLRQQSNALHDELDPAARVEVSRVLGYVARLLDTHRCSTPETAPDAEWREVSG